MTLSLAKLCYVWQVIKNNQPDYKSIYETIFR
jgi:hypothetical protein